MLEVIMVALGLGFFLVAVGYAMPANASEENENAFRLYTRPLVAAGLLCYLLYALLRPEEF